MTTKVDGLGLTAMQSVKPPRAARMLAIVLFAMFLLLPPTLVLVPWQQNVQARGKVTALDPLDRVQRIPAPVTGRLVELNVQEGVYVERGEVLARMSDQDLGYALRLEQNLEYARNLVTAAEQSIDILGQQVVFAESARDQAVSAASSELEAARNAVSVAEKDLEAASAELEQKRLDYERKQRTYERGTSSQFDFQVAEREFRTAQAKSDAATTKVEQASNYRDAMAAKVENVRSGEQGKIEKIKSEREKARQDLASARTDLTEATTALERQNTQVVTAPRAGFVQRVYAASTADFLSQGSPLIELIPDTEGLAVELWVRGIDAPLITPGRRVRLQFEGWPAVQIAGWPSVAVGTFGGVVGTVDAQGNAEGKFRVLILPDPQDTGWPDRRYLRQGVRTKGWLLLDSVSLGYEIWRNLNAFPPSVREAPSEPETSTQASAPETSKQ